MTASVLYAYISGPAKEAKTNYCSNTLDNKYGFIYQALLKGCKQRYLDQIQKQELSYFYNTGTGHLLSISGLHIGGLALIFFFLINFVLYIFLGVIKKRSLPFVYISIVLSCIISLIYVIYIGVEVPRLRSVVMLFVLGLSLIFKQLRDKMLVIPLTVSVVLFMMPDSFFKYSFYYSFIAVGSLYICRPKNIITSSFCVFLFLIPLSLHASGKISFMDPLNNMIVIPFFTFIYFPLLLFSVLINRTGIDLGFKIMDFLSDMFIWSLEKMSEFSEYFFLRLNNISTFECVVLYLYLLLLLFLFRSRKIDKSFCIRIFILVVVFILSLSIHHYQYANSNRIINYYIERKKGINGSGDITLMNVGNKKIVFDTGPGAKPSNDVIKKLKRQKAGTIDYLLLSHSHLDHFGGFEQFIKEMKIKKIVVPYFMLNKVLELEPSSEVFVAYSGASIKLEQNKEVNFYTPYNKENNELSFSLDTQNYSILFTSDLGPKISKRLILDWSINHGFLKILQIPHHCSSRDNKASFLNSLDIDVAFCNRHESLLKSGLDSQKIDFPVYVTGICGDTMVSLEGCDILVSSQKCEKLSLRTMVP